MRFVFYHPQPIKAAKRWTPLIVFCVLLMLTFSILFKGLKNLHLDLSNIEASLISFTIASLGGIISSVLVRRIKEEEDSSEELTDPFLFLALGKTYKHLNRSVAYSKGKMHDRLAQIAHEVGEIRSDLGNTVHNQTSRSSYQVVESIFAWMQMLTASSMAFAHGANDVANAIGPLSAVVAILQTGNVQSVSNNIPSWILLLGGSGIVIGLATWGWRVIETIGKKITELTPSRGFAAEFAASTTILFASKLGLPISTTHTLVGAVLGVGLARGMSALNLNTVRDIFISWIVTVPAGALLSIIFFQFFRFIFI